MLSGKVKGSCNGALIPARWVGEEPNCLCMIQVRPFLLYTEFSISLLAVTDREADRLTRTQFKSRIILSSETSSVSGTIDFGDNVLRQTGSGVLTIPSRGYSTAALQERITRADTLLLLVLTGGVTKTQTEIFLLKGGGAVVKRRWLQKKKRGF